MNDNKIDIIKYPLGMRILHWLMAALILGNIVVGILLEDMDDETRGIFRSNHKSVGLLVLLLLMARLWLRMRNQLQGKLPDYSFMKSGLERMAAKAGHFLIYALIFFIPFSGYISSNMFGYPVNLFGIPFPTLIGKNVETAKLIFETHGLMAYILLVLIVLHVAAVIKHIIKDKYPVHKRMM
jgi:cytochrome b561